MKRRKGNNLRLNLGCGYDHKKGFINVDVDRRVKPDLIHDLYKPLPFADETVKEIYLQDVLEHFTKEDGVTLLRECERVLKKGGTLTLRVPNVHAIFRKFNKQKDLLFLFLYGDTTKSGVWGAHKYGYSPQTFEELLENTQLQLVSHREEDTNYLFICRKGKKKHTENVVYSNIAKMILFTPLQAIKGKKVQWIFKQLPHPLLGKTILRFLSSHVKEIVVTNEKSKEYVRRFLHYSHLRIHLNTE